MISTIAQFILGFFLGLFILTGSGFAAGYYFFTRMAVYPEKPVYSEEEKSKTADKSPKGEEKSKTNEKSEDAKKKTTDAKKGAPPPAPKPETPAENKAKLEPGAYRARVTWPQGLSVRAEPNGSAKKIDGVDNKEEIIILKTSDDGKWQKVRLPNNNNKEGWVKAGNTEKI